MELDVASAESRSRAQAARGAGCARRKIADAGDEGRASEVFVLPFQRRAAAVHWRVVRVDGGDSAAGHPGTAMEDDPSSRTQDRTPGGNHAAAEERRDGESGAALGETDEKY